MAKKTASKLVVDLRGRSIGTLDDFWDAVTGPCGLPEASRRFDLPPRQKDAYPPTPPISVLPAQPFPAEGTTPDAFLFRYASSTPHLGRDLEPLPRTGRRTGAGFAAGSRPLSDRETGPGAITPHGSVHGAQPAHDAIGEPVGEGPGVGCGGVLVDVHRGIHRRALPGEHVDEMGLAGRLYGPSGRGSGMTISGPHRSGRAWRPRPRRRARTADGHGRPSADCCALSKPAYFQGKRYAR